MERTADEPSSFVLSQKGKVQIVQFESQRQVKIRHFPVQSCSAVCISAAEDGLWLVRQELVLLKGKSRL
jgi:hypothetical protein